MKSDNCAAHLLSQRERRDLILLLPSEELLNRAGDALDRTFPSAAQPTGSAARFEHTRLAPAAFTAYGLQSIIQHVAHLPGGTGTRC